ncbi:unnamed protein product [Sphenostylis stenocarpa]|uniref:PPIase cyclophilin-type domain-containing protein n=1 Tax=Sphenostylis stenocarpa TaxID=92480 RepID=A0AA86VI47_9FABA|nr:unnamed protein product [Sphenostylis stenocarpa]
MGFLVSGLDKNEGLLSNADATFNRASNIVSSVLGLFGNLVPLTVSNFKSVCLGSNPTSSSYKNTLVHKVFPGQYFLAGRPDKGEVRPPRDLPRNTETVDSKAFTLTHSRPSIVSLLLSENDDDDIKLDPEYQNVEFLITTGPHSEFCKFSVSHPQPNNEPRWRCILNSELLVPERERLQKKTR